MRDALAGLLCGAIAGSIPFAWLVHRFATGRDLRKEGSGNPGASNVDRTAGRGWGVLALALEIGKGAAGVAIATRLRGDGAAVPAAIGAVVGHVYSPWLRGRGGRGVAAAAGAFGALTPWGALGAAAVFVVVVAWTRWISLGSVAAAAALPVAALVAGAGGRVAIAAASIAALIAWRHRENFERMRAGTEPRIGNRGSAGGGRSP